ncbi:unnamed protein product, partial [Porites evermanni]
RIPLVLTYHPLNERIKRILLRNLNILSSDPETRAVFPQPPLVAYRPANPANTLATALAITFLATLVSVALNTLWSSRRRSLAKRLAWSTASPVAVALPSISAKQSVL